MTDENLHQIWSLVSDAPSKHLKIAIQESFTDHTLTNLGQYSFHQAEIVIVRGMGKAKLVTNEIVELVRTSSFFKEPLLPAHEPSPSNIVPELISS